MCGGDQWAIGGDGDRVLEVAGHGAVLGDHRPAVLEFDGLVKYSGADGREALVAEKRRKDRLRDLGFQVVRVTWAELDRPTLLQHRIQAAFARTTGADRSG